MQIHPFGPFITSPLPLQVAGLGNHTFPGTRHSVGMAVLNHLASKLDVADQWKRDKQCCADVAVARLGEAELLLMKPRKFMNLNGISLVTAGTTGSPSSSPLAKGWLHPSVRSTSQWEVKPLVVSLVVC